MTDKVQKIREEVARLKLCTMDEHMKFYSECAEAEYNALCKVEEIIDSLQEEPVSKVWHRGDEFKDIKYQRICKKVIGNMENKRFAIGDVMEVENGAIDLLYEDGCVAMCIRKEDTWAYLDDLLNLSNVERTIKNWEEPVSEDLEEVISYLSKRYPEVSFAKLSRIAVYVAKWQKEQMIAKAIDAEVLENYDGKVIKYDEDALD